MGLSLLSNKESFKGRKTCNVAAIDIGTNSTHLLIAALNLPLHSFSIEYAEKSTTRLGERDLMTGDLTEVAMARVEETLRRFKQMAQSYEAEEIVTVATSAVREAKNGQEFLQRIKREISLEVELISGPEEGRLIYLGVLSGMTFGESPYLLLDIGGGSTELVLADGRDARALTSTRVGAVRLQRDFIRKEPIPSANSAFIQAFVQGSMESAIAKVKSRIKEGEIPGLIATSGTAMAIGSLIAAEEINPLLKLHGYKVSLSRLDSLVEKLLKMSPDERRSMPGINQRRADIIVPGALILQTCMRMLNVNELTLSDRALREGLIVDWMLRNGLLEDRYSFQSSIRKRTVIHQLERFSVDKSRAERVALFSLKIYDKTYGSLHLDNGCSRELLWAASMLFSCGQHINSSAYHKHSWYLIRHGELLGYSHGEHMIISAIARYHRRGLPKKRHEAWQALLSKDDQKAVSKMSLILRLSSAIDCRPEPVIKEIDIESNHEKLTLFLTPFEDSQDLSLEKWRVENCSLSIKEITGQEVYCQIV